MKNLCKPFHLACQRFIRVCDALPGSPQRIPIIRYMRNTMEPTKMTLNLKVFHRVRNIPHICPSSRSDPVPEQKTTKQNRTKKKKNYSLHISPSHGPLDRARPFSKLHCIIIHPICFRNQQIYSFSTLHYALHIFNHDCFHLFDFLPCQT